MTEASKSIAGSAGNANLQLDPTTSSDNISIQLPTATASRRSWLAVLGIYGIWALIIYLAVKLLVIWVNNRSLLKWWQDGDKGKHYNNVVSVWLILSYTQGNYFLYIIQSLFLPPVVQLSRAQVDFIEGSLFKYQTYLDPVTNTSQGILTPKQLCDTVLLHKGDEDANTPGFTAWLKKHPNRVQGEHSATDAGFYLTFAPPTVKGTITATGAAYYDFTATPILGTTSYGVYPCVEQSGACNLDWLGCIQAWLNGGIDSNQKKWFWTKDANDVWQPYAENANDPDLLKAWFNVADQPDNFIARYGIMPESPLIIYFANGTYSVRGMKVDSQAFINLVNVEGWVGFLNGLGQNASLDDMKALCFSKTDFTQIPPLKPCAQNKPLTTTLATGTAFGSSMMMAFFAPTFFLPILGASLAMGVLAAGSSLNSASC
jgi:hypothetical protein